VIQATGYPWILPADIDRLRTSAHRTRPSEDGA